MKTSARLLFGVRVSRQVRLSMTVDGGPQLPQDLQIRSVDAGDRAVAHQNAAWTVVLEAGDHIVLLPAHGEAWFEEPVHLSLDVPATIFIVSDSVAGALISWTTDLSVASDPKNPWPPPAISSCTEVPPGSSWFLETLTALRDEIRVDRSMEETPSWRGKLSAERVLL